MGRQTSRHSHNFLEYVKKEQTEQHRNKMEEDNFVMTHPIPNITEL